MSSYENEHQKTVIENAAECTVLLKSNGDFPIDGPCKIAAYGAGLRHTIMGGTGSGEVNTKISYTIEEGLEREGFTITSKKWLDEYDRVREAAKKPYYDALKKEARQNHENIFLFTMGREMTEPEHNIEFDGEGDVAIYVLSRNSGEGSDRKPSFGDVKLAGSEVRDITLIRKKYRRFMLVLNVGGVVDLSPVKDVENILLLSQLCTDCGRVLSDILTGKQTPSGKLTTTWAAWESYSREGTFGDWNETRYNEGIYVGYRFFDSFGKKSIFPFGYGLSYTYFDYKTKSVKLERDRVTVKVNVKNSGEFSGKEVIQAYVSQPEGKLDKAYQELAGFKKTSLLKPLDSEDVEISFKLSDIASYDEESASYILEKGDYLIRIGNSSDNTTTEAVITLDETAVVLKTRNCLGKPDFKDIKRINHEKETIPEKAVRLELSAKDIEKREVTFDKKYEIDKLAKTLTDEELAYIAIGAFKERRKDQSVVGDAATHVAGAAGETTSRLVKKGLRPLIMADGPAGLRVAKKYYEDERGEYAVESGAVIPESMFEVMGPLTAFIAKKTLGGKKPPKGVEVKEHTATRIPIGTAIAQSFNPELAKAFGDIVGSEMEEMGVDLWLAPALNIHRSILCGRNFEYFSEDPLVSGTMAAALTEGVQSHRGRGTTIKHYAANNAETNRYCNNSLVSERAMREIYLRGFGICVRESQPVAVMTSYNLLNGRHTSEHRGLIEDVLRCEYGFKGFVMTDWVLAIMTSKRSTYRNALSNEVAAAGGDVFMPGSKKDYMNVLKALKSGKLDRKQLMINATRIIRATKELSQPS